MTNHPAQDPRTTRWRCGARSEDITLAELTVTGEDCLLAAGHDGWHRADSGNTWKDQA